MKTCTHSTLILRSAAGLALASFLLAASASAQTVLVSDSFPGESLNTTTWTSGSTGSQGTFGVTGGNLTIDVNRNDSARAGLVSNGHNFNPFGQSVTVALNGIGLGGTPGSSTNSLYAVIGRLPSDTGGDATGALASTYSAGSAGYGVGGALGVSLNRYASEYRLQILDSGSSAVAQTQVVLSGAPTDIVWEIDGINSTWAITLSGATFSTLAGTNGLNAVISSDLTSITGTFSNFTEAGITSGEDIVSRFVIGANNGGAVTDGAIATFGSVSVTAVPEPSTYALLASAFFGTLVMTRRVVRRDRR
ncbi:PEP-CTERM putative exosortase interaction domain-containing protein [Opitutaceae bacterium TAV1]|nr:PEP-CTERM putative exosortase interaction domain-containing protein [Opitutaceae bacterium TAV1]